MFRIDNATSQASPPTYPSAGTPGHFTKGNPGGGVAATVLDDWWVDQVQEELCNVIGATGVTLAKGTNTQLRDAILSLMSGHCQLQFSSTTAIKLMPYNGRNIVSGGIGYQLPAAGVTGANTGVTVNGTGSSSLANSTVYLISYNGASNILKYWALGTYSHGPDTTSGNIGTEVITLSGTPQTAETLVGMIATDASSHFQSGLLLRSWFNEPPKSTNTQFSVDRSLTSSGFTEVNSEIRNSILVFAGEAPTFSTNGELYITGGSGAIGSMISAVAWDGSTPENPCSQLGQYAIGTLAAGNATIAPTQKTGLSEGLHYATIVGGVTSLDVITGNWRSGSPSQTTSGTSSPVLLTVSVRH